YIGSQEAFSKKDAKITVTIIIGGEGEIDSESPVVNVQGVGKEFEGRLKEAGIDTVGKLLRLPKDELKDILKKGGTKPQSYYSTKAINILEAAKKGFYDKAHSSGMASKNKSFALSNGNEELILSWEYWDGKGWVVINRLNGFKDDQISNGYDFKETGRVEFPCPEDIEAVKVAGQENYWIRVRIISGDYGKE
ncbi:MAG: hypothetical protein IMF19_02580, partial [Proteobacteria bacterium]|nr:hypothetical protein [Pseudomonadota bacterium]